MVAQQRIIIGHVLDVLSTLDDQSVHCVVTSPPYYGLRNYNTEPQTWGGSKDCDHDWQTARDYVEGGGGERSAEAFHEPGVMNAARLNQARWRQDDTCATCGAWRGHLGLEPTLDLFIAHLVQVFREVRRVLRDDGVCFLNMGDSYASSGGHTSQGATSQRKGRANVDAQNEVKGFRPGLSRADGIVDERGQRNRDGVTAPGFKQKDLVMVPERLAIALQADGWYVRSKLPWVKRNCMPESVTDRPTTAVEYVFMLTKQPRYYWDHTAVRRAYNPGSLGRYRTPMQTTAPGVHQPDGSSKTRANTIKTPNPAGRGFRNTDLFFDSLGLLLDEDGDPLALDVNPRGFKGSHFATFPTALIEPLIQGGTSEKCCADCGTPWRRVVELVGGQTTGRTAWQQETAAAREIDRASYPTGPLNKVVAAPQTTGWEPGCTCHGSFVDLETGDDDIAALLADMRADDRPQRRRAAELFDASRLGDEHVVAIRAVGMMDEGTRRAITQHGVATADHRRLAGEAKGVLGGYVREFLGGLVPKRGRVYAPNLPLDQHPVKPCVVLDPFVGSGTTLLVADRLGREGIGIELSDSYADMALNRIRSDAPMFVRASIEREAQLAFPGSPSTPPTHDTTGTALPGSQDHDSESGDRG